MLIGKGAQGRVYKAFYFNKLFALKKISIDSENHQSQLEKELQILTNLDHINIIKFFGAAVNLDGREQFLYQLLCPHR